MKLSHGIGDQSAARLSHPRVDIMLGKIPILARSPKQAIANAGPPRYFNPRNPHMSDMLYRASGKISAEALNPKSLQQPKSRPMKSIMTLKVKTARSGFCVRCGAPAHIHSRGMRAGSPSIYCSRHLLEQRKKNRARAAFNRWIQAGGDPAAWAAVAAWRAEEPTEFRFENFGRNRLAFK